MMKSEREKLVEAIEKYGRNGKTQNRHLKFFE